MFSLQKSLLLAVATSFALNAGFALAQTAEQTADEISRAKERRFLGLDETEQEKKAKQQKQKAASTKKKPTKECTTADLVQAKFFSVDCYMPADGKVTKLK